MIFRLSVIHVLITPCIRILLRLLPRADIWPQEVLLQVA